MIPVQRPYLGEAELRAVSDVFDTRWLGMGSMTKSFEDRLREMLGVKHVIAVNTGTSALQLAVESLNLEPGDEIVVPSLTYVASVQAIIAAGGRPVFCEAERDTLNIDVADAASRFTDRTRAVMPVHYGGLPCDLDALLEVTRPPGIAVVEDAAHAFGSSYHGRPIGGWGDATCFSFDPIKNITCGEGGAIATDRDDLAARIVPMRILGIDNDTWSRYRNERTWFYTVAGIGYRYHMSNINAAIGLAQLDRLPELRARRTEQVRRYDEAFADTNGIGLIRHDLEESFPFFYIVRVLDGRRDALIGQLKERGVGTGVHYIPNHIQPMFESEHIILPVTDAIYEEILTLPLFHEMTDDEQGQVIEAVVELLA